MTTTDPDSTPCVTARDLWWIHGRGTKSQAVLRGAELTAAPGEIVAIVGGSGSGKSTLLRILAGLERPDRGSVLWDPSAPRRRPAPGTVAAVFQDAVGSLDPNWSIARSVAEPIARGTTRKTRHAAALDALVAVGLGHLDPSLRPARLSGGQCQRVALARAFVGRPRLLLADEPTSALDASAAVGILHLLRDAAESGTAVILVTHDREAASVLATRTLRLADGVLTRTA